MNKKLLILASMSLFLVGSMGQLPGLNVETDHPLSDKVAMPTRSDAEITRDVKNAFAADKDLSFFTIAVDSSHGIVTLVGMVDTAQAKANLETKAKAIPGVKDINNKIEVKSGMR